MKAREKWDLVMLNNMTLEPVHVSHDRLQWDRAQSSSSDFAQFKIYDRGNNSKNFDANRLKKY